MRRILSLLVAGAVLLLSAAPLRSAQAFFGPDFSVGIKGFLGGQLWTKPDSSLTGDSLGFGDVGGGVGFGGGAYLEMRLLGFFGLELDLLYDHSRVQRNVTINRVVDTTEYFETNSLRIPILLKAILPLGLARISFGLGPEFVVPLSASSGLDIEGGFPGPKVKVSEESSTLLDLELGVVIDIPGPIEIPIGLRAGYNLSQESGHADRVAIDQARNTYTIKGRSSWDFRLMVGLGYQF